MDNIKERIAALTAQQKQLLELRLKYKNPVNTIPHRKDSDILSASLIQEKLWIFQQLKPDLPLYNESRLFSLIGHLNPKALEKSINEVITRHEILRTSFEILDEQLIQIIHPELIISLPIIDDLSEYELPEIIAPYSRVPFNLNQLPLLRGVLIKLAEQEHIMLLVMHHIISDGWSWKVFSQELATFYAYFCHNIPINLPSLSIQYADYSIWQKQCVQEKLYSSQLEYWKQQLHNLAPLLELPTDYSRTAIQSFRGARQVLIVPPHLTNQLRKLSNSEGVTLFMLLLTAFKTLLFRYTGQTDIVIGTPVANRQTETENLLGCFLNTIVLKSSVDNNFSFRELLQQIKETTLAAYKNQDLSLEELIKELQPERSLSYNPIFQVMFVFQENPLLSLQLPDLTIESLSIDNAIAKLDLTLYIEDTQNQLTGFLEYSTDLFKAQTIQRLIDNWQILLESITTNPEEKIAKLSLLNSFEKKQLLFDWNNNSTDNQYNCCLHHLFEEQANRTPMAVALTFEEQNITYHELNQKANQLAHYLQELEVKTGDLVGICLERSLKMVIALLAIIKAGAVYIPIDPQYPSERINFILEDSQVKFILTQTHLSETLPVQKIIDIDRDKEKINQQNLTNPINNATPYSLIYVIYTSGSTGKPKGAMNTHRGVCNRLLWMQSAYHLQKSDVVLQKTPFTFDVSVWEFFWPLITGGHLVIAKPEGHKDSAYLVKLIQRHNITTIHFVPSMLQVFLAEPKVKQCHSLKRVICSGEALPYSLQERFFTILSCELHNLYGPTEAAIDVTFWQCQPNQELKIVPIGRPISNIQIYILDSYLQPVPIGVPGELHIGGVGVAKGYLNRPELTAEKFITNPFGEGYLYKTGDLARYLSDGNIEYIGRLDYQIKLRGFRIELGEIESTILKHPAVREVVVIVKEYSELDQYLITYIVLYPKNNVTSDELGKFLSEQLPQYMIPSVCIFIDSLPLTSNGKVNRLALASIEQIDFPQTSNYQAANTPVQEILVGVWEQLLPVKKIGIDDNFFSLGGHSLLATQLISRLRKIFQIEIPLNQLFEAPTIAEFAQKLEKNIKNDFLIPDLSREKNQRQDPLPLSFAQQRLWTLQQLDPESTAYNGSNLLLIKGLLNVPALEKSINEIIKRHEVLRTVFQLENGQPIQKIYSDFKIALNFVDLKNLSPQEQETEVKRLEKISHLQPFDLRIAPLLRLNLLHLETEKHILLVTMHHIISDAWSTGIFIEELSKLYQAFSLNHVFPLEELPIQYADFAIWQRQWLQGNILEQQLNYWQRQLDGANTVLNLPTNKLSTDVSTSLGAKYHFQLSASLSQQLEIFNQKEGVTLFMTLLAAYNCLLYYHTKQIDILVGSPIANRNQSELERLIGFFVNTLVLRTDMSNNPSFRDLLQRIRQVALQAYTHQDIPFEKLVAEIQPDRNLKRNPFFQVWFVLQNTPKSEFEIPGLNFTFLEGEVGVVRHDLKLEVNQNAKGIDGFFEYKIELFSSSFMSVLFNQWQHILEIVIADPEVSLNELVQCLDETVKKNNQAKINKIKRQLIRGNNEF